MKIELTRRYDSIGFYLRPRRGAFLLAAHYWTIWRYQKRPLVGGLVVVNINGSAGYIGGSTLYLGWRARGGLIGRPHGPWPRLRIGWTCNGNAIPYSFR